MDTMPNKTFEIVINGKTYTTLKLTPMLRGKIMKATGLMQRELANIPHDEIGAVWANVVIAGVLQEVLPPIIWDFLKPEDKTQIGTIDDFYNGLSGETINSFYVWAASCLEATNDFLQQPAVIMEEALPTPSTPSTASLQEGTAGLSITASP